ncbi:hypothetical protein KSF_096130 [Reticulibacter mediterranei]|uniref:Uncharacterized protein n=1 Tax=Reticulibacter mediterranei TaxID=2778369 RepID=A0A8J3N8I5_9CHLR|nr:hypothetical protein [Reticulibacter mediterranei]GHO99565.1 hypothetical protein KSF_096130 [Reticulibacter mediterranei]
MDSQPFITGVVSVCANETAGWLQHDQLKPWQNYTIVTIFFVFAVIISVACDGGLTGDPGRDLGIILAECIAIFAVLKPLREHATTALPSPFSGIAQRQASQHAAQEEAAAWAAALVNVPPRASASMTPPPPPPGLTGPLPPQPGMSGTFNQPLRPRQFVEDARPTIVNLPTVPKPPTKPLQP